MDLLLLSSSAIHGRPYLSHALSAIDQVAAGDEVVFIPYALADWTSYLRKVAQAVAAAGVLINPLSTDPAAARHQICHARVILVGGGNTFRLLDALQALDLVDAVRENVMSGRTRYIGTSAGTNIAAPSIRTTNDMPICWPRRGPGGLGLIPFQVNPHYVDPVEPSPTMQETRDVRLSEYLEENSVPVLALYESSWVRRSGDAITLRGRGRWFTRDGVLDLEDGTDLSALDSAGTFDTGHPTP